MGLYSRYVLPDSVPLVCGLRPSVTAGVSYASKPEFLGEIERNLDTNSGLRYQLIRQ